MPSLTEEAVLSALRTVQEPELGGDLVTRNMVKDLSIEGKRVAFTIELTTPACPLKDEIEARVLETEILEILMSNAIDDLTRI